MDSIDADLVSRCLTGERSAFEALVGRHQQRARAVAGSVLGNDQPAIDDVVQEAFVLAYRRLADLDDPARFPAWLRRIVHNQAVSWIRRQRSRRAVALPDAEVMVADDESEAEPEDPMLERLRLVLPRLRPAYREILALKYEAHLDYAAIAETLGTSVANVEKRLYRARRRLQTLLESG